MSKELKGWENLCYLLLSYSTMTAHTPLQSLTCQLSFPLCLPSPTLHHQVLCFLFHCLCPFLKFFLSVLPYTTSLACKALLCAKSVTTSPLKWNWKWKLLNHIQLLATPWNSPWNSPGQNTGVGSHSLLRGSFQARYWTQGSHIACGFFSYWVTREAPEYWSR